MRKLFEGTAKSALVHAPPGILRKTAITWWHESGVSESQAADWAGHSEKVARIYYASRSIAGFSRERALLERRDV